jgi:hypothetical protein
MRRLTPLARGLLALAVAMTAAACRDRAPTAPGADAVIGTDAPLATAVAVNSTPLTLAWLAPLGSATASAPHDQTQRPLVTVCRWKDGACAGVPLAQFAVASGLSATDAAFEAEWNVSANAIPAARTTYRITVTNAGAPVGLPLFVDVSRGRFAPSIPGQTPPLTAISVLRIRFRLGVQTVPPPPIETVASGLESASTQFLPTDDGVPRTPEQTTALTTLAGTLATLQTALSGPADVALTALSEARSAADFAFRVAVPGDKADLDVIRLELAQAGRLFGVGN